MDTTKTGAAMREVSDAVLDEWATDPTGPVALHLKQKLLPVESLDGKGGIVYPPTYADIGYNIDTLADGTKVALIDSVGSQANRMEPIFKEAREGEGPNPLAALVPQLKVVLKDGNKLSILDIPHRAADSTVKACPSLVESLTQAFDSLRRSGDCSHLCALAPTSLLFGVWDSRGKGEKRPRLVRSVIRAWDVDVLSAAAQYSSAAKLLDENTKEELQQELDSLKGKKVKNRVADLAEAGFADVPSTFRKNDKIREYIDGRPNLDKRVLGGVLVRDRIEREVTVNLVALRGLRGPSAKDTVHIRKYLLGLALLAATADIDLFLREGCHVRYVDEDVWHEIPRRGEPTVVNLDADESRKQVEQYAKRAYGSFRKHFGSLIPEALDHNFDLQTAKRLLVKQKGEDSGS